MRKITIFLMSIISFAVSFAQTEQGKKFIGGRLNLNISNSTNMVDLSSLKTNSVGFQISPNFGYFIKDNFALGVFLTLGTGSSTTDRVNTGQNTLLYSTNSKFSNYGGGVFARHYIKIADKFMFFSNGRVSYTYGTQKYEYSNIDPNSVVSRNYNNTESNYFQVSISPGLVYFITPKLGIETTIGNVSYQYTSLKNTDSPTNNYTHSNNFGLNFDPSSFYLGLNYYF